MGFIGSVGASTNKQRLKDKGVTHILIVGKGLKKYHPQSFEYLQINVDDHPRAATYLASKLPTALAFIARALSSGGSILVHCFAGKSRSATVVLAYLMVSEGLSLQQAMAVLRAQRPVCQPNLGFMAELLKVQRNCTHLQRAIMNNGDGESISRLLASEREEEMFPNSSCDDIDSQDDLDEDEDVNLSFASSS